MDGYRVRFSDPTDAPLNLPALFGASRAVCVLERLEMTPMPYRGGVITVPIAREPSCIPAIQIGNRAVIVFSDAGPAVTRPRNPGLPAQKSSHLPLASSPWQLFVIVARAPTPDSLPVMLILGLLWLGGAIAYLLIHWMRHHVEHHILHGAVCREK